MASLPTLFLMLSVWVRTLEVQDPLTTIIVNIESSKVICAVAWWDTHIFTRVGASISLATIFVGFAIVSFAYYSIVHFYIQKKALARAHIIEIFSVGIFSNSRPPVNPNSYSTHAIHHKKESSSFNQLSHEELKLLIKALAITGTYFVCWVPYSCKIMYEMIAAQPVSSTADAVFSFSILLYPLLNGLFLIFFDGRINSDVIGIVVLYHDNNPLLTPSDF